MKEAELPRPQNRPDATRPAALLLHGPAEPVVPRVLDSPHSGAVFPPDVASALSELDLREDEDAFVDHMNEATRTRHAGFETLQKNLRTLVDALLEHLGRRVSR